MILKFANQIAYSWGLFSVTHFKVTHPVHEAYGEQIKLWKRPPEARDFMSFPSLKLEKMDQQLRLLDWLQSGAQVLNSLSYVKFHCDRYYIYKITTQLDTWTVSRGTVIKQKMVDTYLLILRLIVPVSIRTVSSVGMSIQQQYFLLLLLFILIFVKWHIWTQPYQLFQNDENLLIYKFHW